MCQICDPSPMCSPVSPKVIGVGPMDMFRSASNKMPGSYKCNMTIRWQIVLIYAICQLIVMSAPVLDHDAVPFHDAYLGIISR